MTNKHLTLTILLLILILPLNSHPQDHTQVDLPEGAIARLGKGGINTMRFSPDGSLLAVGTDVGLWLYDVSTGQETPMFTGEKGQISTIAFSPDGKTIVSGGFSNPIIQLWDVDKTKKQSHIKINNEINGTMTNYGSFTILDFTKNAKILTSLNTYRNIQQWDIETGKSLSRYGNLESLQAVAYSKEYNGFATGNRNGGINLYDAAGKIRIRLRGHAGLLNKDDKEVWSLTFSPDGSILASGSEDKTIRLWNTKNGKQIAKLQNHRSRVISLAFSSDSKILASGDQDRLIKLWSVETHRELATLLGHTNGITSLVFSPDGRTLASGSYDGTIRFWNQDTGEEISTFATAFTEGVKSLEFTNDNTLLTSVSLNGTVDVWSLRTRSELNSFTSGHSTVIDTVVFTSDATLMAAHSSNWTTVFDPTGSGFSGGGKVVSKGIRVRDLTSDQVIHGPWEEMDNSVNGLVFSNDKKILVASVGWEGIFSWDLDTGKEMFTIVDKTPFDRRLVYSPNGDMLASYGIHSETHIWKTDTQQELTPINMKKTHAFAFSPDNTRIATAPHDGITFWSISESEIKETGKIGGTRNCDYLTFSPDGKILLSALIIGWDYFIKLYDVDTGLELSTLPGHTERITVVKFSKDGKTLASGSYDGTILLWDWEDIVSKARNEITGKNLDSNIIPPIEPIQYANKAEEAEAIINWLQENGYELNKTSDKLLLKRGKSSSSVIGTGGTLGLGDVHIQFDKEGIVKIRVDGVGSSTYTFDDKGNLKYMEQ